ncbi:hypothetical protein FPZ12_018035 [Amycolatopsis acidicola]|uniref:Cobalamin-independent methionine synthase MetE C-terminal/archaeal domain-containing protein n=1 Tax=Amycolatopsis acidicola TaxID=2596893 RepID=A0A5N0V1B5_9PSEU|nr:hypothetical protein [Amycolatopsis acidicola]KAA9160247.1 hypothetical protein FPZ12_018035 [Amycolatopsis acidicola]
MTSKALHVGSLLPPEKLARAREDHAAGRIREDELRWVQEESVLLAFSLQYESGLREYTDGEYLRASGERSSLREAAFLRDYAPGTFKVCLPDVTQRVLARLQAGARHEPAVRETAAELQAEADTLADAGVPRVQLDAPRLTDFADSRQFLRRCVYADLLTAESLRNRGVSVSMHLCGGRYDDIAPDVFATLPVDHWLVDFDPARTDSFAPLKHVPDDARVVLGVMSAQTPEPESVDSLARRVDEAATFVPMENLAISPHCGFARSPMTWDDQRRKLDRLVAAAERIFA